MRVVRDIDRGSRTVDGIQMQTTDLVRTDHGRNFEVHSTDTGANLTADCLDTWAADARIATLLHATPNLWSCPGSVTGIDAGHADLIADHVPDGDAVDGAGRSRRGGRHG